MQATHGLVSFCRFRVFYLRRDLVLKGSGYRPISGDTDFRYE
jgi:hypothetical protein